MDAGKIGIKYFLISLLLILFISSCTNHRSVSGDNFLITANSVGPLHLGMEIEKIDDIYNGYSIRYEENYGYFIFDADKLILNVWSKDEYKTISGIKVYSDLFHTEKGIRVGMSAKQLEKIYGPLEFMNDFESGDKYSSLSDLTRKREMDSIQ